MRRWPVGLLVSVLAACGAGVQQPGEVKDSDALASTEQELTGDCTADWAANPCTVADTAACGTGSASVDSTNSPNNCELGGMKCDPRPRLCNRNTKTYWFTATGPLNVYDSLGNVLGSVSTGTQFRINLGTRQTVPSVSANYLAMGFSVPTNNGAISGLIRPDLTDAGYTNVMSWLTQNYRPAPDPGGTYSNWYIIPSNNTPYEGLHVTTDCPANDMAVHYLGRNGRINLITNLPGKGSPTKAVYPNTTGLNFKRAQAQHSVSLPLYDCTSGSAVKVSLTLDFLYGYVQSGHWGWIAMPNLSTTPP
ncbi:MAG: hypothetical protein ACJ8AT_32065 [Hyalangium sp.]|uniref:hypothetical protein n=1 Tax=Hyalangium sp. TaxID=2028555 RepID=UPI00389A9703